MTWALAAALILVMVFAIYQAIVIQRLLAASIEPPNPKEAVDRVAEAIVDAIVASLDDRPEDWEITDNAIVHKNGMRLFSLTPAEIIVTHLGSSSTVTGEQAQRLVLACQRRNSMLLVHSLRATVDG